MSIMDTVSIQEAVLKAKVAQIADHVGYHAITQGSSNILVDIYRRKIVHLARYCKEFANNNRRTEATIIDLKQAYDSARISIPELQEYIEAVNLPLNLKITLDGEKKPSNRIQRNLLIDDLLEAEKNHKLEDQDDGENKAMSENGVDDEEKPTVPLLKDTYEEITKKFMGSTPVKADKQIRLGGRILTKLKISAPLLPEPEASSSIETSLTTGAPTVTNKKETSNQGLKVKGAKKRKEPFKKVKVSKKGLNKKKPKTTKTPKSTVTPLDPSIAEPPSFLSILDTKSDELAIDEDARQMTPEPTVQDVAKNPTPAPTFEDVFRRSTPAPEHVEIVPEFLKAPKIEEELKQPSPAPLKQPKTKKKKKSNKFAIATETVKASEEKEWLCPICNSPDNGDIMVQCDKCQEWYHIKCTSLKKPPEDDDFWECDRCVPKMKIPKKPPKEVPVSIIEPAKAKKTPEPIIQPLPPSPAPPPVPIPPQVIVATPPPPPAQQPRPVIAGTSSDDLCPECNLPDDGTMMIQCEDPFCAKWFHGKCVNLLEEPTDDMTWFCKVCIDKQQSAFKRRRRAK